MIAALILATQIRTYPTRWYPVGWQGSPPPGDAAAALGNCRGVAATWLSMSNGVIQLQCTGADPYVNSFPFPPGGPASPPCETDYSPRDGISGEWWVYFNDAPGCQFYRTNLGTPGSWQKTGGQTAVHEWGHNLGLQHTAYMPPSCGDFDPGNYSCMYAYAPDFDTMGTGTGLTAYHRLILGLIPSPPQIMSGPYDLDNGPCSIPDGSLTFYLEKYQDVVVSMTYTGWPLPNQTDSVRLPWLLGGQTFTDPRSGMSITAITSHNVSVSWITPAPSSTPTPTPQNVGTPTYTPTGENCMVYIWTCTPTPSASATPSTFTPSATPSLEPSFTPTSTPAPSAIPTCVPTSSTPTQGPITVPPRPTTAPIAPTTKPTSGGCGSNQAGLLLLLPMILIPLRKTR